MIDRWLVESGNSFTVTRVEPHGSFTSTSGEVGPNCQRRWEGLEKGGGSIVDKAITFAAFIQPSLVKRDIRDSNNWGVSGCRKLMWQNGVSMTMIGQVVDNHAAQCLKILSLSNSSRLVKSFLRTVIFAAAHWIDPNLYLYLFSSFSCNILPQSSSHSAWPFITQ